MELISRILGHNSTETTKIYTVPSIEMLAEAMGTEPEDTAEKQLWEGKEDELARLCGLRP